MNQLFNFDRRVNRTTYFVGLIIGFVFMLAAVAIMTFLDSFLHIGLVKPVAVVLIMLSVLAYLFYALCLTKQRANDISGDNALLYTLLAIFILNVIIGVIPGEKRQNRYGSIPGRGLSLS